MDKYLPIRQRLIRPDGTVLLDQIWAPGTFQPPPDMPFSREIDGDAGFYWPGSGRIYGKFREEISYLTPKPSDPAP